MRNIYRVIRWASLVAAVSCLPHCSSDESEGEEVVDQEEDAENEAESLAPEVPVAAPAKGAGKAKNKGKKAAAVATAAEALPLDSAEEEVEALADEEEAAVAPKAPQAPVPAQRQAVEAQAKAVISKESGVTGYNIGNHLFVRVDRANFRSGPGLTHPVTGFIKQGERVEVYERNNGWVRIGDAKWVFESLVTGFNKTFTVTVPKAEVRSAPHKGGKVLETLNLGAKVQVQEMLGKWAKIGSNKFILRAQVTLAVNP